MSPNARLLFSLLPFGPTLRKSLAPCSPGLPTTHLAFLCQRRWGSRKAEAKTLKLVCCVQLWSLLLMSLWTWRVTPQVGSEIQAMVLDVPSRPVEYQANQGWLGDQGRSIARGRIQRHRGGWVSWLVIVREGDRVPRMGWGSESFVRLGRREHY